MDPVILAHQATNILVPALSALCIAGKPVFEKGKEVLGDMLYEKAFEKLGKGSAERATLLLKKINPKIGSSLDKALKKVSCNPEDSATKEDMQQEILKLLKKNPDLAKEIELIVNININIDVVKQLVFGNNNLILNLEGVKGEELIKIMEYMDWKRQEELKQEVLKSYSPSVLPDYSENLIKYVTENRAKELSQALKHLQKNKILLFSGIAGVGKTTLTRVLVNFRPTGNPEPFWFNFYHNRDANLEDVLEALAAYLEAPEILSFKGKIKAGNTDINRLTEELKKRNSLWLVFDDLSYIINEKRNFIDPGLGLLFTSLRDNNHRAKVILTSRVMPLLDNGEYLIDELETENRQKIEGLKPDFAVDYLRENGFENIKLKILESLVESVEGHPFSLKLLVGLAKKHTAENILKDLRLFRKHQKDRIKNARFLFDKLVGGEKELLEHIAVYRQPESLEAIEIMLTNGIPIDSVDTLLDKSLLETDPNGNYWLHPLVQEFSYEDLKNKKEVHMIAYNYYKSLNLPENPTKKEDLQPAIEAHYHACMSKEYDKAFTIIFDNKLDERLDLWGNYTLLIDLYSKLLPEGYFGDEILLKDKGDHGFILGNLGNAYYNIGDSRKAIEYYKQELKIDKEIDDRRREGNAIKNLGNSYIHLGEPRKAIKCYEQATEIAKEIGDRCGECSGLGNLGFSYSRHGDPRKAIEYYKQAIEIARKAGDRRIEGIWIGYLGNEYSNLGDSRKAIEYCEQAMEIARAEVARRVEGIWIGYTGNAYRDLGETRKAIEYHKQALEISREIGDRRGEGNALGNMGLAYDHLGETRKAIEYCEQALNIAREIGDRCGEGSHLGNMGLAYSDLGEPRKAIEYFEKALKISREIDDKRGEGNNLGGLGVAYIHLGENTKAIEFLKQSLAIGKAIEDPRIIRLCEQKLKELEGSNE